MKVTLVFDAADADRLAWLADVGRHAAVGVGFGLAVDAALVERIRSARRHSHRSAPAPKPNPGKRTRTA